MYSKTAPQWKLYCKAQFQLAIEISVEHTYPAHICFETRSIFNLEELRHSLFSQVCYKKVHTTTLILHIMYSNIHAGMWDCV